MSPSAVTFHPASHPSKPLDRPYSRSYDLADTILRSACEDQYPKCKEILKSSFPRDSRGMSGLGDILPQKNGFVLTVLEAYNNHRALVIRPDDVWLAILVQFNFFVNGNAELLRKSFVSHEGQKKLVIEDPFGDRYTMDYESMCRQMIDLVQKNVVDPSLRDWLMPTFSTTTISDTTVYAMVMMATLKAYFIYTLRGGCGIPSVTLEGNKSDWEALLSRLDKLQEYGTQMVAWRRLLYPILSRFVSAFDSPNSPDNLDFWSKVAQEKSHGSGYSHLTGWITAFTVFDLKGNWMGRPAGSYMSNYPLAPEEPSGPPRPLILDGVMYPVITTGNIAPGYAEAPVNLEDPQGEVKAHLVAGSVASQICGSRRDTVKPLPGWWIFTEKENPPRPFYSV
ncbi:hypothetical protein HYDPIDRAFT_119579 [Hydnomerulius pinastri MD-312]|uniref:Uncharacterized protein n=1 Tax=Hydnomerulius pinastri MD-312 TaxID=994086 RepID=A0A0C9W6J9_9AGAM|nr:hypothetical protein HYDPIDRAFT_119579 [Hydnomerulius pinastri MD-312]